jgi:monofunctional biosynthetic peptidoglycan transglycosylase
MLDQKPDRPDPARGDVEDAVYVDVGADGRPVQPAQGEGGGGALGRFRAGIAAKPRKDHSGKPLWRRILVFIVKWTLILIVLALLATVALVFLFRVVNPPPTFTMAQRSMAGAAVQRTWVPLNEISINLVRAVIADEDQRFCDHKGFDMVEIQKAINENAEGGRLRGASTLSQQTAKNVFLFQDGGYVRKGAEAYFTWLMEQTWSKRRIMEVYLNVAEWGDGLFGAEAAAQARFGVSARNLTRQQAAQLAAVLPSPNRWRVDGDYAVRRRGPWILRNMSVIERDGLDRCLL